MPIDQRLNECIDVLSKLGLPISAMTKTRQRHAARVFLALAGLEPSVPWTKAQDKDSRCLTTKQILSYGRQYLGETRSNGSYDDVRREDLRHAVAAGIVQPAANKPGATTNDATRGFGLDPLVTTTIRTYGTPDWDTAIHSFQSQWPSLVQLLARSRQKQMIAIKVGNTDLQFTADPHNQLQKAIIEKFLPLYGYGADVLYVGDTADKYKHLEKERLEKLGFFELGHDELPDVIAYSEKNGWLYLIEAVTSTGPVDEIRRLILERKLARSNVPRIYITAFLTRGDFKHWAGAIAWETEAWIAENPEHLVHFNGDKFLGPHAA